MITGGPHPPTPAHSRPAMVSAPALHPRGPDLITVGRKLWVEVEQVAHVLAALVGTGGLAAHAVDGSTIVPQRTWVF